MLAGHLTKCAKLVAIGIAQICAVTVARRIRARASGTFAGSAVGESGRIPCVDRILILGSQTGCAAIGIGCRFTITRGSNSKCTRSKATVKMKDYGFFLPLAAKGKNVVIDGKVELKTTSVAELRHYAEDAKKTNEEINAITKPTKEVRVMAKGIVIVE